MRSRVCADAGCAFTATANNTASAASRFLIKIDRDRLPRRTVAGIEFEKFRLGELKLLGDKIARELIDLGVHLTDAAVVIAARRLNLVFDLGEIILQAKKIIVRSQVRIVLGDCEHRFESAGQQVFRLRLRAWGSLV